MQNKKLKLGQWKGPVINMNRFSNPIIAGADPFIISHEGVYYHYSTSPVYSNEGILVHSSKDLINWKNEGYCLKKGDGVLGSHGFWAPEVLYYNNKFYMVYVSELHLAVASADSPLGPFKCESGKWLLERQAIDGSFFIDDDFQIYLYYVRLGDGGETIWAAPMSDMYTLCEEKAVEVIHITEDWERIDGIGMVVEGPFMLKHKGKYYLSYSANDYQCQDYAVGYAVSDSPLGKFEKFSKNPILRRKGDFVGTGHHSFTKGPEGELLAVYHVHNSKTVIHPRLTCIDEARFVENNVVGEPDILKIM